jgi:RNA polymerase sigma-70 factor (ECF subfamily)
MKTTETMNFNQVYAKFYNQILHYVNTKVNNINDAEDITAKVFVNAYKHFDKYNESVSKMTTWLHFIANNAVIDFFRANKYHATDVHVSDFVDETGKEMFEFVGTDGNDVSNNRELREAILKAFASLKPKYRRIANLYFMHEKEYSEIAEICNVPLGTVKGMINRCRTMLQAQLVNA